MLLAALLAAAAVVVVVVGELHFSKKNHRKKKSRESCAAKNTKKNVFLEFDFLTITIIIITIISIATWGGEHSGKLGANLSLWRRRTPPRSRSKNVQN